MRTPETTQRAQAEAATAHHLNIPNFYRMTPRAQEAAVRAYERGSL